MVTRPRFISGIQVTVFIVIQNPWYIVTIVALTAGNRPEGIPLVFKYVLSDLERAQNEFKVPEVEAQGERLRLARRFRDAIFKCGILAGYSKVCYTPYAW